MMMPGRMGGDSSGTVSCALILYAMAIAVGISVVAGIIPAYRASKLKPAEALRYE